MTSTETNIHTSPSTDNPRLKIGSRDKSVGWYQPTLENITEAQRDLLENYSHIHSSAVIPHILEVVSSFPTSPLTPSLTKHGAIELGKSTPTLVLANFALLTSVSLAPLHTPSSSIGSKTAPPSSISAAALRKTCENSCTMAHHPPTSTAQN